MDTSLFMPIIMIVVMFGIFYFLIIRPQKKKDKETADMRNSIQVGDVVITIGGIIGLVTSIHDDTLVLETGSDRSKIRVKKWAVQSTENLENDSNSDK
ncbi:MAG: preprotein translocase subunit YajC [Oscillospiraceae bacterium]|nr:preprotein translocase subunit YajC [Oscillospiraceae bacterium]